MKFTNNQNFKYTITILSICFIGYFFVRIVEYKWHFTHYEEQYFMQYSPLIFIDDEINVNKVQYKNVFEGGWGELEENTFKWTVNKNANFYFKIVPETINRVQIYKLKIKYKYLIKDNLRCEVVFNKYSIANLTLQRKDSIAEINILGRYFESDNKIILKMPDATSTDTDSRILGIAVKSFSINNTVNEANDTTQINYISLNTRYEICKNKNKALLGAGWSVCEQDYFKWSDSAKAQLFFKIEKNKLNTDLKLIMVVPKLLDNKKSIDFYLNGTLIQSDIYISKNNYMNIIDLTLSRKYLLVDNQLLLHVKDANSPGNGDKRQLGLQLNSLIFTKN